MSQNELESLSDEELLKPDEQPDVSALSDEELLKPDEQPDVSALSDEELLKPDEQPDVSALSDEELLKPDEQPDVSALSDEELLKPDEQPDVSALSDEELLKPDELQEDDSQEKKSLGIFGTLKAQKEQQLGRELSTGGAILSYIPGASQIIEGNENRQEIIEQRLFEGKIGNPLDMIKAAKSIGIDQGLIDDLVAKADSGQRSIAGFKLNLNPEPLREGLREAVRERLAARIQTRQEKQQQLANNDINLAQQIAVGTAGGLSALAALANPVTAAATLGADAINRGAGLAKGQWTVDENGNPVRVAEGDADGTAIAKGLAGATAERAIWMGLGKIARFGGEAIGKIPGVQKIVGMTDDALGGIAKGAVNATDWLAGNAPGRILLKTGEILGKVNTKTKFGSLPEMMLKSRLAEFADEVAGLNVPDALEREGFRDWLQKFISVEDNAELLTSMIGIHALMATGSAIRRGIINHDQNEILGQFLSKKRVNEMSPEDRENIVKLLTSPGLTLEKAEQFVDDVKRAQDEAQKQINKGESLSEVIGGVKGWKQNSEETVAAANLIIDRLREKRAEEDAAKAAAEERRMQIKSLRGSNSVAEQLQGLEEFDIYSWEDAEKAGFTEVDEKGRHSGGAVRALNIAFNGTDALRQAARDGRISPELAEDIITSASTELGGHSKEERVRFIDGILQRAEGDEALARRMMERLSSTTDEISDIDTTLERIANEVKVDSIRERNPGMSSEEARGVSVEPVETEDGRMMTAGKVLEANDTGSRPTQKPETPYEGAMNADRMKGTELKTIEGGLLGVSKFPDVRVQITQNGVIVEGLTDRDMSRPENAADVAALLTRLGGIAKKNGLKVVFPDEATARIAAGYAKEVQLNGLEAAQRKMDTRARLFKVLSDTTLGNGTTFDEQSFRNALAETGNGRRWVDNHGNIYGFVDNKGVIHFNPAKFSMNTPIHEYGHVALEAVKRINPKLWEKGMELIEGTAYLDEIERYSKTDGHEYSYLRGNREAMKDEALAKMIGDRGEKLVVERGLEAELKKWIKEIWKAFKEAFGVADLTDEQIERMSIDDFVNVMNAELLRGREFGLKNRRNSTLNRKPLTKAKSFEQHYQLQEEQEAAAEAERWASSGMNAKDYILSRVEEGEPAFDLDWETAREIANDAAQGKFQARAMIDGRETALAENYPLSLRDARNVEKVVKKLSGIVGQSAAQIGEIKLTRITDKSLEHLVNSGHARSDRTSNGRDAKRIWRGTVAGLSVLKDIIGTSNIGNANAAKHDNSPWKKDAKFYEADTRFAIQLDNGKYEIYPCKLIVSEYKGERMVYDLTEIGTPTLSAIPTANAIVPGVPQRGLTANGGIGATGDNIPKSGTNGNWAKMSVAPGEAMDPDVFTFNPSMRIVAMGDKEQNAGGLAAAIEKKQALRPWTNPDSPAARAKPIALDAADMVMFWKAVTGTVRNPHIQKGERIKGRRNAIGLNVGGNSIELVSKLFGVIDEGDIRKMRQDCRVAGYFRFEDPDWLATKSRQEIEAEMDRSRNELDRRTASLYNRRVKTGEGGGHYSTQVLGHEIGHTIAMLPNDRSIGPFGDSAKTLFNTLIRDFKKNRDMNGEARELIKWWHGTDEMPAYYNRYEERFAELFGIFLTQPESVHEHAPKTYDAIVRMIGRNERLKTAMDKINAAKWDGKADDALVQELEKTWSKEADRQYRELDRESRVSTERWVDRFNYALNDRFGPLFSISKRGIAAEKKRLAEAVKDGAMSEAEAQDRIAALSSEVDALKTNLYDWQRQSGGSIRLMIADWDNVMRQADADGVNWRRVRLYAHLMRVIELGGRATAHGIDPARAQKLLDNMREKDGAEAFAKVEKTWKAFRAVCEKSVLDDPNVKEMFDDATNKMLYENKHYVTMRHRMSVEETAEWQAKVDELKRKGEWTGDVALDIYQIMHRGLGGNANPREGFVLHHLTGSFAATTDPIAATMKRYVELKMAAAKNHLIKQAGQTLKDCGVKGVMIDSKSRSLDPKAYGVIEYMDNGVRKNLVVPRVIYDGFKAENRGFGTFGAVMRFLRNTMTLWNPAFINRAYLIDKSSLETNIEGLHKPVVDILSESMCFRGIGVPLYMVNNYLTRFTPIANTWIGNILWSDRTANHYAHRAQKIARIVYEGNFTKKLQEAQGLREVGDLARATEIEENVAIAREMMRKNVFQSAYQFNLEQPGLGVDDILQKFGYRIEGDSPKTWNGKVWSGIKKAGMFYNRFEEEQEAVTKIIAYLYDMKKNPERDTDARARLVIEQGGTPNLAARGVMASYIENATGFFWNVRKEGTLRTWRALKDHPTEWIGKNIAQTGAPALLKAMIATGGMEYLINKYFDNDEEKMRRSWWAPAVLEHCRFVNQALKCVPGYYQRNYNVIPIAKFGDHVLALRMKYSPEEFAIQNAIHTAFNIYGMDPTDPDADWSTLSQGVWDEFLPNIFGRNYALDAIGTIVGPLVGINPYDQYRQRHFYDETTWATRWSAPGNMAKQIGKTFWNYSPLGTFTTTFKDGRERELESDEVPEWLDRVLSTPFVRMIPASMMTVTSKDSYTKAMSRLDAKYKAYARLRAGDVLTSCIERGALGNFAEELKDLTPEMKLLAVRHVINGWRRYHMDPRAKQIRIMRNVKDPRLKKMVREWIDTGMNFDD